MSHITCHCGNIHINEDINQVHNHSFTTNNCSQKRCVLGNESITIINPTRIAIKQKNDDSTVMICKKCGETFQIVKDEDSFICTQDKEKHKVTSYVISENNDDSYIPKSLTCFFYMPSYFSNTEISSDTIYTNNDEFEYDNLYPGQSSYYEMGYFYGSLAGQWAQTVLPLIDA